MFCQLERLPVKLVTCKKVSRENQKVNLLCNKSQSQNPFWTPIYAFAQQFFLDILVQQSEHLAVTGMKKVQLIFGEGFIKAVITVK